MARAHIIKRPVLEVVAGGCKLGGLLSGTPLSTAVLLATIGLSAAALAQRPSEGELQVLSAVLPVIEAKDWRVAEGRLIDGLREFPRSAVLSNALGIVYEQEGQRAEAIRAYEQALEWLPGFTAAQLHLASVYAGTGQCEKAKPLWRTAAEHTPDAAALSASGLGLADCGDYGSAARVLTRAHDLDRSSAETTFNLALALYKNGEFAAALTSLNDLPSGPEQERPEVLNLRGKLLAALKLPGSTSNLEHACRAHPAEDYCNDAALQFIREERFAGAVELLEMACKAIPSVPATMLSTLAMAQFRLGRYHDATETYARAIRLDPALDAAREGLAFLLYMTGDLDKARSVVEQGLERPSTGFYLPYLRALVLYRMSDTLRTEALKSLELALLRNPAFAPSYFLRGKIRLDQSDQPGALDDFQTAARVDSKYPLPHYKMAQIYERQGRHDEAGRERREFAALGSLREEELLSRQAQSVLLRDSR